MSGEPKLPKLRRGCQQRPIAEALEHRTLLTATVSMLKDLNTDGAGGPHNPVQLDDERVVYVANDSSAWPGAVDQ